jgi:hypothetical protein
MKNVAPRIVGQRVDLCLRQRKGRRAFRGFRSGVFVDRHFRLEAFDRQRDNLVLRAALQVQRRFERKESREFDVDHNVSRCECRRSRDTLFVGLVGDRRTAGLRRDRDVGHRNTGTGLVDDHEAQQGLVRVGVGVVLRV